MSLLLAELLCVVVVALLAEVWFVDVLFAVVAHPASPIEASKMIDAAKGLILSVMLFSPLSGIYISS
ncbi:hypothetical protein AAC03nite_36380 [Alicyclobacillus acidoterrestris]|nr:hypothetical protein N007_15615 [Alicyclobacillus acidoterrestris ATCC 49025]GEO27853.1 hypothetical protein AAC03nite_36380 [Alicyclobacillus acidoterrestris]